MAWHRKGWAGWLLRLAGAVLLAIGWYAARRLFAAPVKAPGALDYLLALVAFSAFSAGSAMLMLGAHLFDPVAVARRWQRRF